MNFIINSIQDLAKFLKCEVSEIPEKIKDVRECGIGLTLFYGMGGVIRSTDEFLTFPGKGNGCMSNPDITWNNPGTPLSFKFWTELQDWGCTDSDQLIFGHITSYGLEAILNRIDDEMYKKYYEETYRNEGCSGFR